VLIGLLLGVIIGLLVGPLFRSWLAWREYVEAGREARLADDVLSLMSETPPEEHPAGGSESLRGP
jgi:hypothetical protein